MKSVFYLVIACSVAFFGCQNSEKSELDKSAEGVPLGTATKITYPSIDGLEITADYYPNKSAKGTIIMSHQDGFSRGEYKDIAPKLIKRGYACLAIDLRRGNVVNNVPNETATKALIKGEKPTYEDAMQDLKASIDLIAQNGSNDIILWGSSYTASLSLMQAVSDTRVKKVIAFSPGEYLSNANKVGEIVQHLTKPVFITGSELEYDMVVKPIAQLLPINSTVAYKQGLGSDHGSKTLYSNAPRVDSLYQKIFKFL